MILPRLEYGRMRKLSKEALENRGHQQLRFSRMRPDGLHYSACRRARDAIAKAWIDAHPRCKTFV